MKKLFLLCLALCAVALFTSCAGFGGAKVTKESWDTNKVHTIETATIRPSIAFGDAVNQIAKIKAGNTKTGNSIGLTGYEQETSATNIAPIIKSAAEGFGEAARVFFAIP